MGGSVALGVCRIEAAAIRIRAAAGYLVRSRDAKARELAQDLILFSGQIEGVNRALDSDGGPAPGLSTVELNEEGYFTSEFLIEVVAGARQAIDILMYRPITVTSGPVLGAMRDAAERGVEIRMLALSVDASDEVLRHGATVMSAAAAYEPEQLRPQLLEAERRIVGHVATWPAAAQRRLGYHRQLPRRNPRPATIANASMNAPSVKTSPSSSRTRMASVGFRNAALATTAVCSGTSGNARERIDTATHLTRDAGTSTTAILTGHNSHVTDHDRRAENSATESRTALPCCAWGGFIYRQFMPDLELRHLRYLIAVAETGSITRAARRLTMTQPALSRAIRALERTVGAPLFVRGSHATELTDAGAALLAEAYELVERSRAALELARGMQPRAEILTVSAPVCDVVAVTAASRAFKVDHAGVRVNVVARAWPPRPEELRAGVADVAFLRDCYTRHDLIVDRLASEPRRVLLPVDHPLADRERLTVSDLRDEPISYWAGMSAQEADHWTGADVDRRPRRHGPLVRTATDVLTAVVLGQAIAFVHGSTLPDSGLPGLRLRPVDGLSASSLEIGMPVHGASPLAKEFVEYARNRWPGHVLPA